MKTEGLETLMAAQEPQRAYEYVHPGTFQIATSIRMANEESFKFGFSPFFESILTSDHRIPEPMVSLLASMGGPERRHEEFQSKLADLIEAVARADRNDERFRESLRKIVIGRLENIRGLFDGPGESIYTNQINKNIDVIWDREVERYSAKIKQDRTLAENSVGNPAGRSRMNAVADTVEWLLLDDAELEQEIRSERILDLFAETGKIRTEIAFFQIDKLCDGFSK